MSVQPSFRPRFYSPCCVGSAAGQSITLRTGAVCFLAHRGSGSSAEPTGAEEGDPYGTRDGKSDVEDDSVRVPSWGVIATRALELLRPWPVPYATPGREDKS